MLRSLFLLTLLITCSSWLHDESQRKLADGKRSADVKTFVVNLDLPQNERWQEVGELYADRAWQLVKYLKDNLPDGWLEPLEQVAGRLMPFFTDYGEEMQGYAKALGVTDGDIVMINLVYQLEHLGLGCGMANTTGPANPKLCPDGGRPQAYGNLQMLDEDDLISERDGPGMCTSFVAHNPEGEIFHGRNLDWNLQDSLKEFIINVDYTRQGQVTFSGTTIVGFVGILHAVKENAFSWSMDARRKGGSILFNTLEAMFHAGARTPEQHARTVFESGDILKYDDAVSALSTHNIVNPAYYIVSGVQVPQGIVLARSREGVANSWRMEDTIAGQQTWWVGITNYDLEHTPPPSDDRSTPLTENLNALAGQSFGESEIWTILKTWPTFNAHTDITMVAKPKDGFFEVVKWYDHGKETLD